MMCEVAWDGEVLWRFRGFMLTCCYRDIGWNRYAASLSLFTRTPRPIASSMMLPSLSGVRGLSSLLFDFLNFSSLPPVIVNGLNLSLSLKVFLLTLLVLLTLLPLLTRSVSGFSLMPSRSSPVAGVELRLDWREWLLSERIRLRLLGSFSFSPPRCD